ncbi:20230_t:CDS:2 [Entrophospora sp. SA101]|nr:9536_t:CDS:2 [Entrophospora sp. SA101]CAJ0750246.1 15147_t:CDS:2 [Entrophospora sp. SA101]CAJ0762932.1 20230_t:CDS:2 [Entrophospora sp. SA101]
MAREVTQDFMDIDDEITLQDITFQVVEFRKEQIFDTFYEKSSNTLIYEHAKINNFLIIIPWIVLEELDGLKNAPGSLVSHSIATTSSQSPYDNQANVKTLAKTAITFLHNCLSQKLDGLRGQKIYEKLENAKIVVEVVSTMLLQTPTIPDEFLIKTIGIPQNQVINTIINSFCSYLPTAMIYYFEKFLGHDWTYFVKDPEPWSILTIFKLLDRYWFTVFSEVFQDSRTIQEVTIVNARSFIDQWQNSSNKNYSNLSYNYNMIDDNNNNSLTIRELVQFIQNSETIIKLIYSDLKGTNLSISQLNAITEKWWQEFQASLY